MLLCRGPSSRGGPVMSSREAPPPPVRYGGPPPSDEARHMARGEVPKPLSVRGVAMERQTSAEVSLRPSSYVSSSKR